MDDVKIKVIDSDKLINAINEGIYDINLSIMMDTKKQESARTFVELVVEYPDPELCTYKEYKGKPYYSIKYIENGKTHVGYGTYNPEVLSQYLKEYFISSEQPEIVRCKDCKHRGKQVSDGRYWCRFHYAFMCYCSDAERGTNE